MRELKHPIRNTSFSVKILLIIALAVIPMVAITLVSMLELSHRSEERQLYLVQNNYDQVLSSLAESMTSIHDVSTLVTVSEQVNSALAEADGADIRQQLVTFEQVSSYARIVEMGHIDTAIYFFLNDDYLVVQNRSTRYRPISNLDRTEWGASVLSSQGRPVWVYVDETIERGQTSLALARTIMDHSDYTHSLGVLLVTLDATQVQSMLRSALPGQYVGICAADGTVYIDNGEALPDGILSAPYATSGQFERRNLENEAYLICSSRLNDSGLFLVSFLRESVITQEIAVAQRRVFLAYLIIFAAMAALLIPMTSWLLRGIRQLRQQLSDVPVHGLRKLKHASQGDEIGQLVTTYNGMVDEIQRMLTVQYDLGREKASAELKALQSQINPHFLYNTLDMVSWMAQRQETENIQQVMQALSQFYKLTLSGGRDIITLEEEFRLCDAFMRIQQMRWPDAIDYLVEADDEVLDARLPKITLQPLIENAIKHGIMQRGEAHGSIIVSATLEWHDGREWMALSVQDNGVGMRDSQHEMNKGTGSHYGMKNIEMRLSLFFEEEIHIQVDSEMGLGTSVSMTLPVIRQEEENGHET